MIQRRRLLAQGYILIFLCGVSSEFSLCLSGLSQHLFCCVCLSQLPPSPAHTAQPGCRTTTKQGSPKSIHICEPSGAGRNLAASPGNASPPFHPALKKESVLQGSFSSALLRPPKSGGIRAGSKEGLFSLVLCEQALKTVQKGQGMATSCNSLKIMGFSRKKMENCIKQMKDVGKRAPGHWALGSKELEAGSTVVKQLTLTLLLV